MDITFLLNILSQIIPISDQLRNRINEIVIEGEFPKKHLLLEEGQTEKNIYFIKQGFARSFYFNDGKEFTSWFMGEGDIMVSIYSFFTRRPALENIELTENSIIQSISWEQLQQLYSDFIEFNIIGRIVTEQYYVKSEERAIALRTLSAKARYDQLIETYPRILQRVTLGQIASHIGITQQALSVIRGRK